MRVQEVLLDRDKRLVGIISLGDLASAGNEKVAGSALKGVVKPGKSSARKGARTSH
jgi:hypothetical protein